MKHSPTCAEMDLLSICESLASNVIKFDEENSSEIEISDSDIEHWQSLFRMTRTEAIEEITTWRSDFTREPLSKDAWNAIRESESATGFSKESYEYKLVRGWKLQQREVVSSTQDNSMYLLRLHDESPTLCMVQHLLGTEDIEVLPGIDNDGNAVQFCYMDGKMRSALLSNLAASDSMQFRPSFLRVSIAKKDLAVNSKYPTLGIDSTLPQHRANSSTDCFEPTQNEYPVRYFFYGTLADRAVLARVIGIQDEKSIQYEPAVVFGANMTSWANKYRGLVNGGPDSKVDGVAYWVRSREEEEALKIYETARYEVVRCAIYLQSAAKPSSGLTFRLI